MWKKKGRVQIVFDNNEQIQFIFLYHCKMSALTFNSSTTPRQSYERDIAVTTNIITKVTTMWAVLLSSPLKKTFDTT